jgi:hypothetical protein
VPIALIGKPAARQSDSSLLQPSSGGAGGPTLSGLWLLHTQPLQDFEVLESLDTSLYQQWGAGVDWRSMASSSC